MNPKTKTMRNLPIEIDVFKKHIINQQDPIRREIYDFSLVTYIANNITCFPVNADFYYTNIEKEYNNFFDTLALSYILFRNYTRNYENRNFKINVEDLQYCNDFIKSFFDYTSPISDNQTSEIVWIYPKKSVKIFISDSFFRKRYNDYFYDPITLVKLIMIMASFSRYELQNIKSCQNEDLKKINYPTLILANIGLYEKDYIKVREDFNGVSISLDLNRKNKAEKIFTKDENKLKSRILQIINETENLSYTMEDFL